MIKVCPNFVNFTKDSNNILEYLRADTKTYFNGTFKMCSNSFHCVW